MALEAYFDDYVEPSLHLAAVVIVLIIQRILRHAFR